MSSSSGSGQNNDQNKAKAAEEAEEAKKAKSAEEKLQEKNLERMEALLKQSAMGIHILFDNGSIAKVMGQGKDDKDFFDFDKMKRVQDAMTALIAKKTYVEKVAYLKDLDEESYEMLVRTYFHIVENTVRAGMEGCH